MKCKYCESIIDDGSKFCNKCGRAIEQAIQKQDVASNLASKPTKVATASEFKFAMSNPHKEQLQTANGEPIANKPKKSLPMSGNTVKLWQSLGNSKSTNTIYTEDIADISEETFGLALQEKLDSNYIPARVERTRVEWEEAGISQKRLVIHSTDVKNSPMCFLVGLDRIGKYTFIEEKTVIYPPNLPSAPGTRVPVPATSTKQVLIGIGIFLAAIALFAAHQVPFALLAIVASLCVIGLYIHACGDAAEAEAHNSNVTREEEAWERAWSDWENTKLMVAYLADTDDKIGRMHIAYSETIAQVTKELFNNRDGQVSVEKASQNDLRQAVEKRRASFR